MTDATIRLATEDDAGAISGVYAPYVEDTVITFETEPPSADDVRERMRDKRPDYPWLVCELDSAVVGYAYAGPVRERDAYRWSVESSLYVDADAHGRGVGTGLYESLLAVLERQGYVTVYGVVTLPNPASAALHESFGFEREGTFEKMGYKHGAWHDVGWWSLALHEHPVDPDPPRTVPAVRGEDEAAFADAVAAGRDAIEYP